MSIVQILEESVTTVVSADTKQSTVPMRRIRARESGVTVEEDEDTRRKTAGNSKRMQTRGPGVGNQKNKRTVKKLAEAALKL